MRSADWLAWWAASSQHQQLPELLTIGTPHSAQRLVGREGRSLNRR
jgi:hypothetical protein